MKKTTLLHSLPEFKSRPPSQAAIEHPVDTTWQSLNFSEYFEKIQNLALGLKSLGVGKGTKVGIYSQTRWEWAVSDLSCLSLGSVVVPIYPNNTPGEIEYILNHSECEFLIFEGLPQQEKNLEGINTPQLKSKISMLSSQWSQVLRRGEMEPQSSKEDWFSTSQSVTPEDLASLVYTSGTTGIPKAAMITHEQIFSEVSEAFQTCGVNSSDKSLTFLPFAHVLGRIEIWAHAYIGYTMAFAESIERLKDNLSQVQPTIVIAVPRIFEKIYSSIWTELESNPLQRKIFEWALGVGLEVSHKKLHRIPLDLPLVLRYEAAKRTVLHKVKNVFGGRLRLAVSGGAPLHKDICSFFHAAEVLILEGYGLTETTAAVCVNTPYNFRFGSVGRPIGDVEIKIAEDGEIQLRSKKVFKGYFKDPDSTKSVFRDGWFCTGDIGELGLHGELRITDRKKDLIKTAGGKYVAPQKLEGLFKSHGIVSSVLIHGDQRPYVVALISPDRMRLESMAKERNWSATTWPELLETQEAKDQYRKIVTDVNSRLASYETIKKYLVLPIEFTIENGDLTPSLKVKRKHLDQKYKNQISGLYKT